MENSVLTMSQEGKSEYCCTVVQIGSVTPIEGSDFLGKTNVTGVQIVVRKDQVKEGDIMIYASNECALNPKFLSFNNLFEIGCREMNTNYPEVKAIMDKYDPIRNEADELKNKAKGVKAKMESLTSSASKLKKKIAGLNEKIENLEGVEGATTDEERHTYTAQRNHYQEEADAKTAKAMELTTTYVNYKNKAAELINSGKSIVDEAKSKCGFFNKYGRVRCITLKGAQSFGFLFSKSELERYCPKVKEINIEEYLNKDFDTVNGELFVKAYVPPIKETLYSKKSKTSKAQKRISLFDRMVEGEFFFHYDTKPLWKNIQLLQPTDNLTVSTKLHGTSGIFSNVHIKTPIKIVWYKRLWNKFVDKYNVLKSTRFIDYIIEYGNVYSSRNVIKNQYINKDVGSGYYNVDIWGVVNEAIKTYIEPGMTLYGEICGYAGENMVQKTYDYGCEPGEYKFMIYRITTTNPNGSKYEWNVSDVHEWTEKLINTMKANGDENAKYIHPIDILYHGTLANLYPEIPVDDKWHDNVLEAMKNDKEHFGMEELEPLCNNKVPREGIVIRKDNDPIIEAFKLKTMSFTIGEAVRVDAGEVDIEMMEAYADDAVEEG